MSWNALMIHVDSAALMSRLVTSAGIAEKSAELLNASRNCARQKMMSSTYRRAVENCWGTRPSTSVCAGESTVEGPLGLADGGASMAFGGWESEYCERGGGGMGPACGTSRVCAGRWADA